MHHGVFRGAKAEHQKKRILILGESHHISRDDPNDAIALKPASYETKTVIKEHITDENNGKNSLHFFQKIGRSFGFPMETKDEKEEFWKRFFFGNYIDVLCGIGDCQAKSYLKEPEKRKEMNDALFQFINDNKIDVVVCFSRLVMDHLPSLNPQYKKEEDGGKLKYGEIFVGGKRDYIGNCTYLPDVEHKNTSVILKKRLEVYGLRHPSARGGYNAENYKDVLRKIL